jgi:hypothetical protein
MWNTPPLTLVIVLVLLVCVVNLIVGLIYRRQHTANATFWESLKEMHLANNNWTKKNEEWAEKNQQWMEANNNWTTELEQWTDAIKDWEEKTQRWISANEPDRKSIEQNAKVNSQEMAKLLASVSRQQIGFAKIAEDSVAKGRECERLQHALDEQVASSHTFVPEHSR